MRFEVNFGLVLFLLLVGGVVFLFFHYGTADQCGMLRQEVRQRFPDGSVPQSIKDGPGGALVEGLAVPGSQLRFLTYDLTRVECTRKLVQLWFTGDEGIGAVLVEE